jgi:phenylacetate-CoA ligase
MANGFKSFRKNLPLPVRQGFGLATRLLRPHPVWDNVEFRRWYAALLESQWRTREQIEEDQLAQLRRLIAHAYENVPYYRRIFDEHKLRPGDVRSLEDLAKIPILTKETVRANLEDLIARNYDRSKLRLKTTSGSTGSPLTLYDEGIPSVIRDAAFRYRQWSWAGYRFGDRVANLRYAVSREDGSGRKAGWDYNARDNELQISPFGMDDERMSRYAALLNQFNPRFVSTMPSSLEVLIRFTARNRISLPKVEGIFCESENVYPWQRELFETHFHGRVFAGYGHSERCLDAVECERHAGYAVSMEYGLLELIDPHREPVTQAGQTGRMVGTGFDTYAMPLIRYETDDLAVLAPDRCSCGREGQILQEIKGRIGEFVVSQNGALVSLPAIYGAIHSPVLAQVREYRFLQEREGELVILIVPATGISTGSLEQQLSSEIYQRIDEGDLVVQFRFMENLPRTLSGKAGLLEQKLPVSYINANS